MATLLLATSITSMLYAVIIKETWFYFKTFPQDRLILKIHVGLVVLGDTASLVGTRVLELPDIQIFCSDSELALLDIQPVADGLGDVFISLALVWQLFSIKTSFSQTEGYALIDICTFDSLPLLGSTIKRLIRQIVQTGSASSIIAICTLIAFLKGNSSNGKLSLLKWRKQGLTYRSHYVVEALLAYLLEKIYVLTLLTNLNMRKLSHANTPFSGDEEMGKKSARINPAVTVDAIQPPSTATRTPISTLIQM
ncbi:hypothetical protein D9757_013321 [Collybiopsis confluens]|uniref:DUF6534 domain-containing protein n=1 Tax=Collybiopsis confluens TaxID=2823264 RepID=A0A8H5GD93_9AGAR|nr:hypothetical protein D9757_013321 [Collybiopsis confluens]